MRKYYQIAKGSGRENCDESGTVNQRFLVKVSGPLEAALRAQNSAQISWENSMCMDLETKVIKLYESIRNSKAPAA